MEDRSWDNIPGTYGFLHSQEKKFFQHYKTSKKNYDWEEDDSFYTINKLGYRSNVEYKKGTKCNIAIGCSQTFGEGMPYDKIWPNILQEKLNSNIPMYNLGTRGASPEECYRILKTFIKPLNIQTVFFLVPYYSRRTFFIKDKWQTMGGRDQKFMKNYKFLFTEEMEKFYATISSDATKYICASNNIKLIMLYIGNYNKIIDKDRTARDLNHFGEKTHKLFAEKFYANYQNPVEVINAKKLIFDKTRRV